MNPSGYYDAATIRESHLAKLTTLEMLEEVKRRMRERDGCVGSSARLALDHATLAASYVRPLEKIKETGP